MTAYYNEFDPFAAQWLRNLIAAGHIAHGDVDERSITDVQPDDLAGYTQCHFFAGIGVWSHALRSAGWPDDRPVWTGSCPCQPFSVAGSGRGTDDPRHLWPDFFRLIEKRRPSVVFGEQVASKDGLAWLDLVQADMEGADYAFGSADTCAAGFGAPHIRQRLYFVADADRQRCGEAGLPVAGRITPRREVTVSELANTADAYWRGRECAAEAGAGADQERGRRLASCGVDDDPSPTNGLWRAADWLYCRDGKWRPVEPGTFPLADGTPNRVGRLRGFGNAVNAAQAEGFIAAYLETEEIA